MSHVFSTCQQEQLRRVRRAASMQRVLARCQTASRDWAADKTAAIPTSLPALPHPDTRYPGQGCNRIVPVATAAPCRFVAATGLPPSAGRDAWVPPTPFGADAHRARLRQNVRFQPDARLAMPARRVTPERHAWLTRQQVRLFRLHSAAMLILCKSLLRCGRIGEWAADSLAQSKLGKWLRF